MSFGVLRAVGASETAVSLVKPDEVRVAMSVLPDLALGVQIQGLPIAGTWKTCRGDDPQGIIAAAQAASSGNRGVYWAINPCDPKLDQPMATKYALKRRWFLIDLDPRRERDTNSTEEEHDAAMEVAFRIQEELAQANWPLPVVVDSGNGWQLLYRIDLPNDKGSQVLLRECIKALGEKYDTDKVELDRKVHDGRRLAKLPGTFVRKGPATPERPHRWAKLVRVPAEVELVSIEQLKLLANQVDTGEVFDEQSGLVKASFFKLRAGSERKVAYARTALEREVAKVVLAPPQHGNDTLNKSAFSMGTLVGAGAILRQECESALFMAAVHNGRRSEAESRATIRSGLDAGFANPRDLSFLEDQPQADTNTKSSGRPEDRPTIVTMRDLMQTVFPPPRWAVPGLLSEGLSLLAGKPKLGKSWMALNLAITIAAGGKALGDMQTQSGEVLYLALEDRLRRVQDRAKKVLAGLGAEASEKLHLAVSWPRQDKGGLDYLASWLAKADNPRLIIVDVLAKFRTASTGRRNAYDEDYEVLSEIKKVLDAYSCSGLALMHCKKGKAEDVVEEVSGTLGGAGCADGVMVLARSRGENEAVLHITGRDVDEKQMALLFDPKTCCWSSLGDAALLTHGKAKQSIIDAFKKAPRAQFWPRELADMLEIPVDTVRKTCHRLADDGLLMRVGGRYTWPVEDQSMVGAGAAAGERF